KMVPCTVGPCHVLRMSYRVVGEETVMGISGKRVRAWKVWVPETRFNFWIARDRPRLEGVTWPGPSGTYSMSGVAKPTEETSSRRATLRASAIAPAAAIDPDLVKCGDGGLSACARRPGAHREPSASVLRRDDRSGSHPRRAGRRRARRPAWGRPRRPVRWR